MAPSDSKKTNQNITWHSFFWKKQIWTTTTTTTTRVGLRDDSSSLRYSSSKNPQSDINPILHGALVNYHSSIVDGCPKLADFSWLCSFQYKKGPGEAIFGIFFENFKNFGVNDFFRLRSKGGTLLCKDQKIKKVKFFLFQITSFQPEYELYMF